MKRSIFFVCMLLTGGLFLMSGADSMKVYAASDAEGNIAREATCTTDEDTILEGVFVGDVKVGGLTKEEAENAIAVYLQELGEKVFVLQISDVAGEAEKSIKLSDMQVSWANPEILSEVAALAKKGNVIKRYKERKDVENNPIEFVLRIRVNRDKLLEILKEYFSEYEIDAVNASISLQGKNADFFITESRDGRSILYEETLFTLVDFIENEWGYEDGICLQVMTEIVPPTISTEKMCLIGREAMGSFSTTFKSSSDERSANIENAASKINNVVLYPGDEFSLLKYVTPFTAQNGYFEASSYFGGKLTDSFGGGVCQVASTLYNAVLQAELEVTKRNNHGLTVEYVQLSADAAVAESSGMDFCFKNNTEMPILLCAYTEGRSLNISIYGYDTRPAERTIKYVHEVLEEYEPGEDIYEDDPELLKGLTKVKQEAHKGYKAVLYKNVYMNGSLTERVKVNESIYKAAPKYISVGTMEPEE